MNKNIHLRHMGFDSHFSTWHTLSRNMILYIHSGTGSIFCKERTYPIATGSLCFVGSNSFYYTLPDVPEEYIRSKLFLSNQELETVLSLFPDMPHMRQQFTPNAVVYTQLDSQNAQRIEQLFQDMERYADQSCYHNALLFKNCIDLLILLNDNPSDTVFPSQGIVQKAVEYIKNHVHEDIRIDSICEAIHVSKYYFCKKFKQATGLTVMNYILNIRIFSAKHMLENTDLSISEISEKCGFSSHSYFCQVFKKAYGMTPRQYQKSTPSPAGRKIIVDTPQED